MFIFLVDKTPTLKHVFSLAQFHDCFVTKIRRLILTWFSIKIHNCTVEITGITPKHFIPISYWYICWRNCIKIKAGMLLRWAIFEFLAYLKETRTGQYAIHVYNEVQKSLQRTTTNKPLLWQRQAKICGEKHCTVLSFDILIETKQALEKF